MTLYWRVPAWVYSLFLLTTASSSAHDFWLQPKKFRVESSTTTPFTLQVGHGPYRQRSPIAARRIRKFVAVAPSGSILDLYPNLRLGGSDADGSISLSGEGTYVLLLETDDLAQSHLPAIRFNDYLRVEGLTPALEIRARQQRVNAEGSERYGRRAKALLQVGAAASDDEVTRPLGLTLEIVPQQNPYAVPRPAMLPVQIYFTGRPLVGALVKLTDLSRDAEPLETHITDSLGGATFTMPQKGNWLLNVIWTQPLPAMAETDFETIFSSLSFGLD